MNRTENQIVADAQSAYQRAMREIKDLERRRELFRLGLLSLLMTELEVGGEDLALEDSSFSTSS